MIEKLKKIFDDDCTGWGIAKGVISMMTIMVGIISITCFLVALMIKDPGPARVFFLITIACMFLLWWLCFRTPPTGNTAFEEYETEVQNKLIEEREDFIKYAKQKRDEEAATLFKQFMESRK